MKKRHQRTTLIVILVIAGVLGLIWPLLPGYQAAKADSVSSGTQAAVSVTDKEIVRNGGFDQGETAWYTAGLGTGVDATAGQDGGPTLSMQNITGDPASGIAISRQELHLPSQTTAASFSFDYRLIPTYGSYAGFVAGVMAGDTPETATLITEVHNSGWVYQDTGWQSVNVPLDAAYVTQIQQAHANGQHVWIVFNLDQGGTPNQFKALLDNVSFKVNGSMDYPATTGSIAYIGLDSNQDEKTITTISPDGNNKQTLWTHPGSSGTNAMLDVAWKPDASELAFSSDHEEVYSAFNSDIYGIQPDGSGLRRITNPPSKAALDAGGYQFGTVTGKVYNNYGGTIMFQVYIEGAQNAISLNVGNYSDETSFSIPNVADLGTGLHYVVFSWSSAACSLGKEYAAAVVDVAAGSTVDAGTLQFNGNCNTYDINSVSWKRDGAEVGFFVSSFPRKVPSTGGAIGTELFAIGTVVAEDVAWSPIDDQILYRRQTYDANSGFYLTTAGGGIGTRKAGDMMGGGVSAVYATPAWLPDGSGFVYTLSNQVRQYILSSDQDTLLFEFNNEYVDNPSLSPDGQYIVFQRMSLNAPIQYDLWIMNRNKPTDMWPLTEDGKSTNPDWSRQDPAAPCVALTGVTITGPTSGNPNTNYTFAASPQPANASAPTYTWSSDGLVSGQGTANAGYSWATEGNHSITVSASNCAGAGSANDDHTVTIQDPTAPCVALTGVTITGPTSGNPNTNYTFTISPEPANASAPVYTWSSDGLVSGQGTASAVYSWAAEGDHIITVNASNCAGTGSANDDHTVTILQAGSWHNVYMPVTLR